jgi:hypothetical protein
VRAFFGRSEITHLKGAYERTFVESLHDEPPSPAGVVCEKRPRGRLGLVVFFAQLADHPERTGGPGKRRRGMKRKTGEERRG